MKVKITPTGESAQVMEFNVSLPGGANASVAPVSTLTVTQRWAKVVNVSTTGTEYVQVTKFDVIIDVIIPNGVSIINQQILDELPTSLPVKGHCAYSVFDVWTTIR